jgi:hypothetical protein
LKILTFQYSIQNDANLNFFASKIEEESTSLRLTFESLAILILHQNKENLNPKDAILPLSQVLRNRRLK